MKKISPYSFLGRLFKNWHIKLISLLLAIAVYTVCFYMLNKGRKVEVPLHIIENSEFKAVSNIPSTVVLNIEGKDEAVYLVDPSLVNASLDTSFIKESGVYTIPIELTYNPGIIKKDIVDISVKPLTVRAKFEKK